MELFINYQKKKFKEWPPSLEALVLLESPLKQRGIAVALNNEVIPRAYWSQTVLNPSDSILIITATQGG